MSKRTPVSVTPDATALRALAHPLRLRLLGMLRVDGPATATALAERLGLNSGATSYHLRLLARHGLVEDAPGNGSARERWWRAVHDLTSMGEVDRSPEQQAFAQAALSAQIGQMQQAHSLHDRQPREWQAASTFSDYVVRLDAAAAERLVKRLHAVIVEEMTAAPGPDDPAEPGVAPFSIILHAFPFPGSGEPQ